MHCLRNTILLVLGIVCYSYCSAQSVSELKVLPSNLERYYIDYEIVGLPNPTATDVANLDLNQYEDLRAQTTSVLIEDAATGYVLLLYSINESIKNWQGLNHNSKDHIEK